MAGLLKRLIKKTAQKATKKVVKKKPTPKSTTAKRAAVRTKAKKASNTKVQTAPASRRVGTKATLNGKPVYWGGKDWGWQSKASLTKITNGTAKKPPTKPNTTKLPVSKTDNSPEVIRARTKSINRSKKEQGYESREDRYATNRAQNRKAKPATDKKGVTATGSQVTSTQYTRGQKPTSASTKETVTKGVKPKKSKPPVTKSQALTAKERQRRLTTKNRDIGAKAAAARIDATKGGASVARGDVRSTTRGATEKSTLKQSAERKAQQRLIEQKRAKQLGKSAQKGETVKLSAADAREAADKYEIDKMKEIVKVARTMEGRKASDYLKNAKKEMKREAASIRKNARTTSLTSRRADKNNPAPSNAKQDPKDLKGNASSRRSLRDIQKEGQRFSADMERRKAEGKLQTPKSMNARKGIKASNESGIKKGQPTSETMLIKSKTGEVAVTRPNATKPPRNSSVAKTGSTKVRSNRTKPEPTDVRSNNSKKEAEKTMAAVRARKKLRDKGRMTANKESQQQFP